MILFSLSGPLKIWYPNRPRSWQLDASALFIVTIDAVTILFRIQRIITSTAPQA